MLPTQLTLWQKFWMGLATVIFAYFALSYFTQYLFPRSPLTVIGEGKVSVAPEKVSMIVTRVNQSTDPVAAINEGDSGIKVLIDSVKSIVGENVEIKQSFYQIVPTPVSSTLSNYQVANAFSISTTQVGKVNELLKSLYNNGATSVANLSFSPVDQAKTEKSSRELAVKDARQQADNIARAAGKHVGRIVSITDDSAAPLSVIGSSASQNQNAQASTLPLGDIEITKRVQVMYEIW